MTHLLSNIQALEDMLKQHDSKIVFTKPQGTYLVWLDCKAMNLSNKDLKEFFIKKAKLGLSPGISFGKEGDAYMRINIAVSSQTMTQAINQLNDALNKF